MENIELKIRNGNKIFKENSRITMEKRPNKGQTFLYNYVIIGAVDDYIRQAYCELLDEKRVYMPEHACGSNNLLANALFKLHWSAKVNAKMKLPLKKIWFRRMSGA